jgi:hypothetical protein
VLGQELQPEDLLSRQPIVGTFDLDEGALADIGVPQGQVWKSRPRVDFMKQFRPEIRTKLNQGLSMLNANVTF